MLVMGRPNDRNSAYSQEILQEYFPEAKLDASRVSTHSHSNVTGCCIEMMRPFDQGLKDTSYIYIYIIYIAVWFIPRGIKIL